MPVSNSTLSRHSLEDTARRICENRGGKWSGTRGMACCPAHDDRTPSLGVTLGRKAILFHCFAGCDQQSVLSALAREGFEVTRFFSGSSAENQFKSTRVGKPSAAALRIWREAEPLGASPAKAYLESRGILAASSALRFHPQTPLGPKGRTRFLPAMIAAVSLTPRRQVVPLLLPDELMKLKNLHGFIKFPEGFPAAPVVLEPRNWPRVAEGFIPRDMPKLPPQARHGDDKEGAGGGAGAASETGDNDGDPRRLRVAHDRSDTAEKKADKEDKKELRRTRRSNKGDLARPGQTRKRRDPNAQEERATSDPQRPAQSELPLSSKAEEQRDGPSARSDIPDPAAHQRAQVARGKADQRLQEEQQKSLLGGAAKQGRDADQGQDHGHDYGDFDPDM